MMKSTRSGLSRYYRIAFHVYLLVLIGVLVPFTLAGAAKPDENLSSSGKTSSPAVSTPNVSEESFIALMNARDDKLVFAAELKQIISYHDKLKVGLDRFIRALSGVSVRTYTAKINSELENLKTFEKTLDSEGDVKNKQNSAKEFGQYFPVSLSESDVVTDAIATTDSNPITFASQESIEATAIFDSVSFPEDREFFNMYKKLFDTIKSFGSGDDKFPLSETLPGQFLNLAGANSYETLTEPQIKSAISKYREVLETTRDKISADAISSGTKFISNVSKQANDVGLALENTSNTLKKETGNLQGDVTSTARALYGHTVGETSFYILLGVFGVVFLAIMIVPKFYAPEVAQNFLKSDFILQFSTVFVLIAAIIILSIGSFITPDQVPVLLAGISGYVLGQLGSSQRPRPPGP